MLSLFLFSIFMEVLNMKYDDIRDFGLTRPFDNLINLENMGFYIVEDLNRLVHKTEDKNNSKGSDEQKG
jgi:hypothetical protein